MKENAVTKPVRDTFLLSLSTALATVIQALATFGLTRLISTEEFGAWREFVLVASLTGVLHAGYADGLQVIWCSPKRTTVDVNVPSAVTTLLATHLIWVAIGLAVSLRLPALESFPFFFTAVGVYAFTWNVSTALQFRAQCRDRFARLSVFSVAYPTMFLVFAGLLVFERSATALHLAMAYCLAAAMATIFVLTDVEELTIGRGREASPYFAHVPKVIYLGVPILSLNYISVGMVNFDKAAAAILFPAGPFAIYAFASVLVALINSMIVGGSRVLLPSFARHADRGDLDAAVITSTKAVVLLWTVALGTYFPAVAIVIRFLPPYTAAVQIGRIFFLASVFLAVAQVVHVNACRALRLERSYMRRTWLLLSAGFIAALAIGRSLGLEALAVLSLIVSALWSVAGVRLLKRASIQASDRITTLTLVWSGTSFLLASSLPSPFRGAALYVSTSAPLWMLWWLRYRATASQTQNRDQQSLDQ